MKNSKQNRDERIRHCQIWLVGDRCDGWEKQGVEMELKALIEAKTLEEQSK